MFVATCECGAPVEIGQAGLNRPVLCALCGREVVCVAAEALDDALASADFDAALRVTGGPSRVGQTIRLGGCAEIDAGKKAESHIALPGTLVSRAHCKFVRIDFGPSRWQIQDKQSTNGLFVNGERIATHDLNSGDVIRIGEYELVYGVDQPIEIPAPVAASAMAAHAGLAGRLDGAAGGNVCPSCAKDLRRGATICVECGIHVKSGRPLITSEDIDENHLMVNAETAIGLISWFVWVTPIPIPLASAAYGSFKPIAIRCIAAITVAISLVFFIASWDKSPHSISSMDKLELWPVNSHKFIVVQATNEAMKDIERAIKEASRKSHGKSNDGLSEEELRKLIGVDLQEQATQLPEFHWWQLLTCAFLHDPTSIYGFVMHLGGNMLFMFVFGSRVNAAIGNIATAILYPILAIAAAGIYLCTLPANATMPMLGASGAINGLAGMYIVLFPVHQVYCAMWIRYRIRPGGLGFKVFPMRGFWILLIYFAVDVFSVAIDKQGNTAHWAHIGGFLTGVVIASGMLISRQFKSRGDLLSLILGKYAWPLIGKPCM